MLDNLGNHLATLASAAKNQAILVAPFIKAPVVDLLLKALAPNVKIDVFTRWRFDELAMGVSDLEVWPLLDDRPGAALHLCQSLHAKCFIFDDLASVGSANLTSRALGWHPAPNLELLVDLDAAHVDIRALVSAVNKESTLVTRSIHQEYLKVLESMDGPAFRDMELGAIDIVTDSPAWLPLTRHPSDLYTAYVGKADSLTRPTQAATETDLAHLCLPPGLSEPNFVCAVAAVMSQMPFFNEVERLSHAIRRFGEYRQYTGEFLASYGLKRDSVTTWQTCLRWLVHFQANRYVITTPKYSELLGRRDITQASS